MWTVHKHILDLQRGDRQTLTLQEYAKLIHVDRDTREPDKIGLWFLVDDQRSTEQRTFRIVGTGHPVPSTATPHGSVLIPPYIWHVFEEIG